MKIYTLEAEQFLPIHLEIAWRFLSDPANLAAITPPDMGFHITGYDGKPMYPGQIITYKVNGLPFVPMTWVTEITHVAHMQYFVDEQRFGPYALWHHKHFIEQVEGGVLMKDLIHYAIPFGVIGRLAHWLVIRKRLNSIFKFRKLKLEAMFGRYPQKGKY